MTLERGDVRGRSPPPRADHATAYLVHRARSPRGPERSATSGCTADAIPLPLKSRPIEDLRIQHALRRPALLREVDHSLARHSADVAKQLVRPRDAVRREQHATQLAEAVGRGDGLLVEAIERRA